MSDNEELIAELDDAANNIYMGTYYGNPIAMLNRAIAALKYADWQKTLAVAEAQDAACASAAESAPAPVGGDDREVEHLASLGAWANPGHPASDWHSKSEAYAEGFSRGHAAGFRRSPAPQVDAASDDDLHEAYAYAYATGEGSHRLSSAAAKRAVYDLGVEAGIAAALRSPVGDKP